jgi:glucose/arabinose dehydrogenase
MQVDRMTVRSNPDSADFASRETVLTLTHNPEFGEHHNAGHITFGPDGYLWITVGDGEAPQEAAIATNTGDLRGSILRIRVDGAPLPAEYTVPLDNPFARGPGSSRQEVYMYGLRNPWRIAFDAGPDLIDIADVGENRREELNVVSRTAGGTNFGWNVLEGS